MPDPDDTTASRDLGKNSSNTSDGNKKNDSNNEDNNKNKDDGTGNASNAAATSPLNVFDFLDPEATPNASRVSLATSAPNEPMTMVADAAPIFARKASPSWRPSGDTDGEGLELDFEYEHNGFAYGSGPVPASATPGASMNSRPRHNASDKKRKRSNGVDVSARRPPSPQADDDISMADAPPEVPPVVTPAAAPVVPPAVTPAVASTAPVFPVTSLAPAPNLTPAPVMTGVAAEPPQLVHSGLTGDLSRMLYRRPYSPPHSSSEPGSDADNDRDKTRRMVNGNLSPTKRSRRAERRRHSGPAAQQGLGIKINRANGIVDVVTAAADTPTTSTALVRTARPRSSTSPEPDVADRQVVLQKAKRPKALKSAAPISGAGPGAGSKRRTSFMGLPPTTSNAPGLFRLSANPPQDSSRSNSRGHGHSHGYSHNRGHVRHRTVDLHNGAASDADDDDMADNERDRQMVIYHKKRTRNQSAPASGHRHRHRRHDSSDDNNHNHDDAANKQLTKRGDRQLTRHSEKDKDRDGNKQVALPTQRLSRDRALYFLGLITKGPESTRGWSVHKALKQYHHDFAPSDDEPEHERSSNRNVNNAAVTNGDVHADSHGSGGKDGNGGFSGGSGGGVDDGVAAGVSGEGQIIAPRERERRGRVRMRRREAREAERERKEEEERELWRMLRLKRNERGEIVLFVGAE